LAYGARFDELAGWDQHQRDLAAETIFRFVFRSLYRLHAFNGDPHPGNYLFEPGGRVTFLDFGLVKHFSPAEIEDFGEMMRAMVFEKDMTHYRRVIERIGLLPENAPIGDGLVKDYFGHFYEFVSADEVVTMTPEYASESVRRIFGATGPYADVTRVANIPPSFVIIQRINMGLYAILGNLHAAANWRRIAEELWPWVDGPPSTPLGEEEAAWVATRQAVRP
jgi:hypothetical protein